MKKQTEIKNRTIYSCDNLPVLRGLSSESVDLIYLDPPFNSNHDYAAPVGSDAAEMEFKDTWTLNDIDKAWLKLIKGYYNELHDTIETIGVVHGDSHKSYLAYMAIRLIEMHRVLKKTGTLYYHCDPTMSHSIKLMLDAVFGRNRFRNEIVWCYRRWSQTSRRDFSRMHDVIFRYTKSNEFTFNLEYEIDEITKKGYDLGYATDKRNGKKILMIYENSVNKENIKKMRESGRYDEVYIQKEKGVPMRSHWNIPIIGSTARERTGAPTQKPLKLLRRIIKASSNEGDLVLDPFAGSATTCVAAEELGRKWIGVDISPKTAMLVKKRMERELGKENFEIHNLQTAPPSIERLTPYIREKLFEEQNERCNGCNRKMRIVDFASDHIIPQSKGGPTVDSNIQLLCHNCNSIKGDRPHSYLEKRVREEGLYEESEEEILGKTKDER